MCIFLAELLLLQELESSYLKTKNLEVQVVLAYPQVSKPPLPILQCVKYMNYSVCMNTVSSVQGSVLYNHFTHGKLERSEGNSITEGSVCIGLFPLTNYVSLCVPL